MIQFSFGMPLLLMGLYGGVTVLVVLALRALLGKRLSKRVMPVLWALVLARLLVPFSISSPLSLPVPEFLGDWRWDIAIEERVVTSFNLTEDAAIAGGTDAVVMGGTTYAVESAAGTGDVSGFLRNSLQELLYPGNLGWLWAAGAAAMALGMAWRYAEARRQFRGIYEIDENPLVWETLERCGTFARVYTCDTAPSPAVAGLRKPSILLPAAMDFTNRELVRHILTHEAMHIRRRDNLVKLVMAAALCVHWYNPLVWLMARELCRDLEAACDESAMAVLGQEEQKPYAQSLLQMSLPGLSGGLFVSAFCRTEVERRIKGVLGYRKLGLLSLMASAVLVLTAATAFATAGQAPFDNYLGDWCGAEGQNYIVRAELNRPIDLGDSRNYARSRTNAVVMEILNGSPEGWTQEALAAEVAKRLAYEFGVEPSAFNVTVTHSISSARLEEEYKAHGILKNGEKGGWTYNGKPVHILEDKAVGSYYSDSSGELDVYVIRDDEFRITSVESFLYYRF